MHVRHGSGYLLLRSRNVGHLREANEELYCLNLTSGRTHIPIEISEQLMQLRGIVQIPCVRLTLHPDDGRHSILSARKSLPGRDLGDQAQVRCGSFGESSDRCGAATGGRPNSRAGKPSQFEERPIERCDAWCVNVPNLHINGRCAVGQRDQFVHGAARNYAACEHEANVLLCRDGEISRPSIHRAGPET